jgi:hypothetical protein
MIAGRRRSASGVTESHQVASLDVEPLAAPLICVSSSQLVAAVLFLHTAATAAAWCAIFSATCAICGGMSQLRRLLVFIGTDC